MTMEATRRVSILKNERALASAGAMSISKQTYIDLSNYRVTVTQTRARLVYLCVRSTQRRASSSSELSVDIDESRGDGLRPYHQ